MGYGLLVIFNIFYFFWQLSAKKAWGVYWTWDPRLTTALLSWAIYVTIVVVRQFAGEGSAERRLAAAGAQVTFVYQSNKEAADALVAEGCSLLVQVQPPQLDQQEGLSPLVGTLGRLQSHADGLLCLGIPAGVLIQLRLQTCQRQESSGLIFRQLDATLEIRSEFVETSQLAGQREELPEQLHLDLEVALFEAVHDFYGQSVRKTCLDHPVLRLSSWKKHGDFRCAFFETDEALWDHQDVVASVDDDVYVRRIAGPEHHLTHLGKRDLDREDRRIVLRAGLERDRVHLAAHRRVR